MKREKVLLLICITVSAILGSAVIIMEIESKLEPHISMLIGMGLGISTMPIMNIAVKQIRLKRKVNKFLKEITKKRKEEEKSSSQLEVDPNPIS
ncbi:MAG: hypothetical protein HY223_03080 [Thaumarchaeota archaeon]|nr:hypothetical protein [Nitrososphaerota archaeon]